MTARRPDERKKSAQSFPVSGRQQAASRTMVPPILLTQNRHPIAAGAAASRSLTRPAPCRAKPPVFQDQEVKMTLQQHIDELRAELEWNEDPAEIRQIKAELEAALAARDRPDG